MAAYGPYGVIRAEDTGQVRIGIVGTPEAIDDTLKLLEEISNPIDQDAAVDCVLHPSFPGMNSQAPFRVHIVTQNQWHRPLHKRDFRSIMKCGDFNTKRWLLQELVGAEVHAISELERPPQVVLCAFSESLESFLGDGVADTDRPSEDVILYRSGEWKSDSFLQEFRDGLKAECMGSLPTEIIWNRKESEFGGTHDRATQAWALSLALLKKAGIAPWRLADASVDSCFIGISYYRESQDPTSHVTRGFAYVLTELGAGFVIQGDPFEWDPRKEEVKEPHLNEDQAEKLVSRSLNLFEERTRISPRKITVHKSTPYMEVERVGFENALRDLAPYGLMTINQRGIFCVRPGRNPTLRGTAIPFDEKTGLVFTSGYVPFLRGYHGTKLPQPIEILENWGGISFHQAAQDLIRLTKLDLGSPRFCAEFPISLSRCPRIANVLQALGRRELAVNDWYYF